MLGPPGPKLNEQNLDLRAALFPIYWQRNWNGLLLSRLTPMIKLIRQNKNK